VEVKSETDILSEHQKAWIEVLHEERWGRGREGGREGGREREGFLFWLTYSTLTFRGRDEDEDEEDTHSDYQPSTPFSSSSSPFSSQSSSSSSSPPSPFSAAAAVAAAAAGARQARRAERDRLRMFELAKVERRVEDGSNKRGKG
jgi:MYXO-CTERM domain-containing protein